MDFLKNVFGDKALTFDEFKTAIDKTKINLVDVSDGKYVSAEKFRGKETELSTANNTIKQLREVAKKYEGVDVEKLQNDIKDIDTRYKGEIETLKKSAAIKLKLVEAGAKDADLLVHKINDSLIKVDGDTVMGLDEQIQRIKKDQDYLFNIESTTFEGNDPNPAGGASGTPTQEQLDNMSDAEYYAAMAQQKK